MRTTVTIDPDLLAEAKAAAARTHRTLSDVVQDALRLSLHKAAMAEREQADFSLPAFGAGGLRSGVNLNDREALAELLGDNQL